MSESLARMSEDALVDTLKKLAGPIIKELARRGYDVSLDAPAKIAADGMTVASLFQVEPAARA